MKKRLKILCCLLAVVFLIGIVMVAGCQQPTTAPQETSGVTRLAIASGWVTGVYYPISGAMSRIAYENMPNISLTSESSGASVANARLIGTGDADLAILQNDIAYYARNGMLMFDNAVENMRGMFVLYPEHVHIVATADSGIKSPADLKGKRVAVGPLGSGTEANAVQIAEIYGLTFDDFGRVERLTAGEAADYLKDDRVDAAFFTVGVGASAIADLAVMKDIVIVEVDDSKAAELISKYPYYAQAYVDADIYSGVPRSQTVAVLAMVVARSDLSTDLMYDFTKGIFENLNTIHGAHDRGKLITLETALAGMPIELHPGAEKYFKEVGLIN